MRSPARLVLRADALAGALAATFAICALTSGPALALQPLPPRLDVAQLAASSRTLTIDEAKLRAALVKGKPEGVVFSSVLDLGRGHGAVAWAECDQKACRGYLATISGGADAPKLDKRVPLIAPAKVFAVDGYAFQAMAYTDLDNDGSYELVLDYRTTEPPRRALGSLVREHVAVYEPTKLSLMFSQERSRNGADTEQACTVELIRQGASITATSTCEVRTCLGVTPRPAACSKSPKVKVETWRKAKGPKRYVRIRL